MRRWTALAVFVLIVLAAAIALRQREFRAEAPPQPIAPAPKAIAEPRAAESARPARAAVQPAIHLAKPVVVRPAPQNLPGAMQGAVIDAQTGAGIFGAELTFSHDDGAYSTTTVPGGKFRFAPREPGLYRLISIEAKGYAPFEREFGQSPVSFTSVRGKDVDGVVVRLRPQDSRIEKTRVVFDNDDAAVPPGSLRGRVVDARTGAPIAAFAIVLWRREGIAASGIVATASFVDPSGAYEIDGLRAGTYDAAALAAGYAAASYAVAQIADGPAYADFALRSGARIAGAVTDAASGKPIEGVALSLEGRRGSAPNLPTAPLSPETATDAAGRFVLDHVPPDALSIEAAKAGYLTRLVKLGELPDDGDAPPLDIALTPQAGTNAKVELAGIGAVMQARGDVIFIQQVVPAGGAAAAGLGPGDAVLAIDGTPVATMGFEGAMNAIRGPEGTTVVLRIRRGTAESDVPVTRRIVRL